jgi:ubiquinone/menaquinone biosynthesis C-methylase UbiE
MNDALEKEAVLQRMQQFYKTHKALVTSPFITQFGQVNLQLLENVARDLDLPLDRRPFLDVGCGTGLLSTYVLQKHGFYVGLDINRHQLFKELGCSRVRFTQGSSQYLPFQDQSIGLLACIDSFEHYPDHPAVTREMYRVLRQDGFILLSVPTYANVAGWVKKRQERSGAYAPNTWAPFDFWKPEEYESFITPKHIRKVFSDAGFTQFRVTGLSHELCYGLLPWLWHPRCPHKIERGTALLFKLFSRPVTRLFPHWSLHTIWRISK